ncbi:MAG: hypothetical protein WA945_11110 [Arcobacteraceae bacterium]
MNDLLINEDTIKEEYENLRSQFVTLSLDSNGNLGKSVLPFSRFNVGYTNILKNLKKESTHGTK